MEAAHGATLAGEVIDLKLYDRHEEDRPSDPPRVDFGIFGSGVPFASEQFELENVPELRDPAKRFALLRKMDNDPKVKGALRSIYSSLMEADWKVQPASDSKRDKLIARELAANLFHDRESDLPATWYIRTPWKRRLFEVLLMLRDGFSMFGKSRRMQGNKIILDHLAYWYPETIEDWLLADDDALIGVKRRYQKPNGDEEHLVYPAESFSLYSWEMAGGNYQGIPFIRPMYKPWKMKDVLERLDIMDAQNRAVGIPLVTIPAGLDIDEVERLKNLARELRGGSYRERAWAAVPDGADVGFMDFKANTKDVNASIAKKDQDISHAASLPVNELGSTQKGSRAVAGAMAAKERIVLQSIADLVTVMECDGVGTVIGNMREYVDLNYGLQVPCPQLVVSKIDPQEARETLPMLYEGVEKGVITPTPELEREVRTRLGYEVLAEEDEAVERGLEARIEMPNKEEPDDEGGGKQPSSQPAEKNPTGNSEVDLALDDDDPTSLRESRTSGVSSSRIVEDVLELDALPFGMAKPPKQRTNQLPVLKRHTKGNDRIREASDFEVAFTRPALLEQQLDGFEAKYKGKMQTGFVNIFDDVAGRVRSGRINKSNIVHLAQDNGPKLRFIPRTRSHLKKVMRDVIEFGGQTANFEIDAQNAWVKGFHPQGLADKKPDRGAAKSLIVAIPELDINRVVNSFRDNVIRIFREGANRGRTLNQIADDIEALKSDFLERGVIHDASTRATTDAFNLGRNAVFIRRRQEVAFAIRTEVGDENTCAPCGAVDQVKVTVGSPEFSEFAPPAFCDGMDRCRGRWFIITESLITAVKGKS